MRDCDNYIRCVDSDEKTPPTTDALHGRERASSRMFYFGSVLYLISFFLPSVSYLDRFVPGWWCAYMTLAVWTTSGFGNSGFQLGVRLTIFGALINLLAIAYIILTGHAPRARSFIALALLACMPPMWLSLYFLGSSPYIGHAAWIVGPLLMMFGDIRVLGRKKLLRIAAIFLSFVLALLTHGNIMSRDPLAQGPSLWGFTFERNRFAGEPIVLTLFRQFPPADANPVFVVVSLLIDSAIWLVFLVATAKLIQRREGG